MTEAKFNRIFFCLLLCFIFCLLELTVFLRMTTKTEKQQMKAEIQNAQQVNKYD